MTPDTPAVAIQDAQPDAWKGAKKPGPSDLEAAVILAAKRYAALEDELQFYPGARSGPAYDALLRQWRESRTALLALARTTPDGEAK